MATASRTDDLLTFPCDFDVKVMGRNTPDFEAAVLAIVRRHAPTLGEAAVRQRGSRSGNYLSITVTIPATSRAQLDTIYRDLTADPRVLMAL